jgi:4-amino-4-deoxy-L-arabinose transferase-like glycosyltransferase
VELGGAHVLAQRLPFLAIGAALPWLVSRIATRWFGAVAGWQAGSLTLLMPLSGTLGILAVPDVPMALAAVLCLDAGARLLRNVDAASAMKLALGLMIGALSHYRFIGVIVVGFIALLLLPQGRRMLRDPRVWVALAVGVLAWLPLLSWNADNQDAGLKFQVVERHPWAFEWSGLWFLVIQPMLVTPILCMAMWKVALAGTRSGGGARAQWRYFGLVGAVSTVAIFGLGFFTDVERISFHWPLPGYLALLVAVPVVLNGWPRWLLAGRCRPGTGLRLLPDGVHAEPARAAGRRQILPAQFRRLGTAGRRGAPRTRWHARRYPGAGRQLQGRRRARLPAA